MSWRKHHAMNHNLYRAQDLALEVRDWAEVLAAEQERSRDLCGYCAIASAELHKRLSKEGIFAELVVAETDLFAHVFVLIEDHVLDVTATQFSEFRNQPVVLLHSKEAEQYDFYRPIEIFGTAKDLRKWQKKIGWCQWQIAYA